MSDVPGGVDDMTCARVMNLLHAQVPLTLLYDLLDPHGPGSVEIMAVEAGLLDPQQLTASEPALV